MIPVPLSDHRRCVAQRGSALIMVIFLITVLYMIVHAMHEIVTKDVNLAIAQKQAFRARQVAEMGINWAMNPAVKPYDRDILDQTLEDGSTFSVKIRGEGGRININAWLQQPEATGGEVVKKLFARWLVDSSKRMGVSENELAEDLYDKMVDWTDADDQEKLKGAERDYYVAMHGENTPYPFNRPFYSLDEMLLVPGFEMISGNLGTWRDYFTIYSEGGANGALLDINAAEPEVIAALGLALKGSSDPYDVQEWEEAVEDARQIVELRWGLDQKENTEDDRDDIQVEEVKGNLTNITGDPEVISTAFGGRGQTTHIECMATVGDFRKRVVLIVRGRTGQPQILSREEVPLWEKVP